MPVLTLLDIAARSGSDQVVGLIEDVTTYAPEFSVIPAMTKPGITYKLTRRTALPGAQFRNINDAVTLAKSTYLQEVKEMYFLDAQLQVDEAVVKADDRSLGDVLADEASAGMQAASITLGSQVYYGVTADARGFAGLTAQAVGRLSLGGGNNTTSIFLVWLNEKGVSFVVGRDGQIDMQPWTRQAINPTATTQKMVWVSNLSSYIGLQVGSNQSVWRLQGCDATNKWTDAYASVLLAKVPLSRRNGLRWFANRTAVQTLQASRSALGYAPTDARGQGGFAPLPTECLGIPITLTDSLVDTETATGTTTAGNYA